jgi:membrane protein implicated in regulation of membrane protease activity
MWVATTFGAASTGTAISALSGAAATNAALAWLGGGALAAGGGGTAAGGAILALSGPIGWSVAGAAILTSVALFVWKKGETREQKQEELTAVKRNTARVQELAARVDDLLRRTDELRTLLTASYREAMGCFGSDFSALSASDQSRLAALVNSTQACAALLGARVEQDADRG